VENLAGIQTKFSFSRLQYLQTPDNIFNTA